MKQVHMKTVYYDNNSQFVILKYWIFLLYICILEKKRKIINMAIEEKNNVKIPLFVSKIEPYDNKEVMSGFTKGLFWSYDVNKLHYIKNKDIIIEQVIEAGVEKDEILMWKLYSFEEIKKVALEIEYLEPTKLPYLAFVLKTPKENFKCFGKKPWYRK